MLVLDQSKEHLHCERCEGPIRIITGDVKSGKAEEAGTLWLWVWPRLVNWHTEITWLFSPIVGRKRPGDLWGLDRQGNLLLIETKRSEVTKAHDPFEDFVDHKIPDVEDIRNHWISLLAHEKTFIAGHLSELRDDRLPLGNYPGVVPTSKKRFEIKRWRHLYYENIEPMISNGEYERRVDSNLRTYEKRGCPPPHYFALFTLFDNGRAALSKKGIENYYKLVNHAGADHVHMRSVRRFPQECFFPEMCEICSYDVRLPYSNGLPETHGHAALEGAIQRDEELSSGKVTGRTHEEVMEAARRALKPTCAYARITELRTNQ